VARSFDEPLFLHIEIRLLIQQIPLIILKLLINIRSKLRLLRLPHQLLMKGQCIIDGRDVLEVDSVGDLETFHAIGVPPLLEMHLEGTTAPVTVVTANFTFVLYTQAMEFVQPVWDGLAVPA
jgi:hypothetical protein